MTFVRAKMIGSNFSRLFLLADISGCYEHQDENGG